MSIAAPLEWRRQTILPQWIDYNGHLNLAYYVLIFDQASDHFLDHLGLDADFRAAAAASTFAAENHVCYLREVKESDPVRITTQLLGYDEKRFHFFHRMHHADEGCLAATSELLALYVDMKHRRVTSMPPAILERLAATRRSHAALPVPEQAGRVIAVKKPQPAAAAGPKNR